MLYIYTITINYQKVKKILFKTVSKTQQKQNNARDKFNQGGEKLILWKL